MNNNNLWIITGGLAIHMVLYWLNVGELYYAYFSTETIERINKSYPILLIILYVLTFESDRKRAGLQ